MSPVTTPGLRTPDVTRMPDVTRARADRDAELSRVRFRRALVLLLMTLVLPGSAQLVAGSKRVGRIAIRVWLGCVVGLVLVVGVSFFWHGFAFWFAASTFVLGLLRFGLVLLAVGWALLLIDAWRLGQPLGLGQRQRLALVGLNGVTVFVAAGSLLFASHLVSVQRDFIITMFGNGTASAAQDGRYNVLLVGGDAGQGRWGLRTDSMTVASIDEQTGKTILFGLPRNMSNFPFPHGSVLAKAFPHGYDCSTCMLNSLATWAGDHKSLFAHSSMPGMDATISGIEGITGLKINYYALVNLKGFRSIVNAMGGLTLDVRDRIPIGVPVNSWIEPGVRKLNGWDTLWFARSREAADDYSRMARQKCVMNAMLQQISPQMVLTKFDQFAKAGEQLVQTDLPASELGTFAQLALEARSQKIGTVSFVPPAINTEHPNIHKIRSMISKAIAKSEKAPKHGGGGGSRPNKGFSRNASGPETGGSLGSMNSGYAANQTQDLSKVC